MYLQAEPLSTHSARRKRVGEDDIKTGLARLFHEAYRSSTLFPSTWLTGLCLFIIPVLLCYNSLPTVAF